MTMLETVLPVVINILLIILLVVGIILVIKCIYVIDKTKAILQNVEDKVNSLNAFFSIIDLVNTKIALITDKVASLIESLLTKLFNRKESEEQEDE